ncbi:hypothetical protein GCM10010168_50230 [Actinoplanes ianthinogenes]|uniref:SseB protein N-terminal domain-containing protein n=1 Tax=Actinoplanes ianthinogenes TaxID=122358 RepID=A0ABM7M3E0_9ACTN|nr:SseB family protein [Actinoplanes ianthinogenes]BCJ46075.1 hypothetical protein Aiant_67320 [Actinoplanes ianthinogenes]GGR26029.1 hypothetical protein GCM10010168_50230 [Actinoplanes ianthinogenes]
MSSTGWTAANDAERRMARAWAQDDADAFADVLLACDLYLPGFPDAGEGGQRLLTRERDGVTYVLVYTSVEALREATEYVTGGWRRVTFAELAGVWPEESWGLAVSPHTPIGAYLGPAQVRELADEVVPDPAFEPADERERAMRAAQQAGDAEVYLDLLVVSDVLLPVTGPAVPRDLERPGFPWLVQRSGGDATIPVFTSPRRLRDAWPGPEAVPPVVRVPFVVLARAWPEARYRLAVNPGSAMAAVFTGAQVPDLVRWAQEMVLRHTAGPQPRRPSAAPPPAAASAQIASPELASLPGAASPAVVGAQMRRVQVVIGSDVAERLLTVGGDRVSGPVRPAEPGIAGDGYLVRWHEESTGPAERPVTDLPLPHGAQLVRLIAGQELVVGTYDREVGYWRPSLIDVLRGETS